MKKEWLWLAAALGLAILGRLAGREAYRPRQWLAPLAKETRALLGLAKKDQEEEIWRQQCQLEINRLAAENRQLRQLMAAAPAWKKKIIPLTVIGEQGGKLVLAVPAGMTVVRDQLVVDSRGLVGKVERVGDYRAEVLTPENSRFRLAVAIWRPGRRPGEGLIAKGLFQGGRQPAVVEIDKDAGVQPGDLVAPLGYGGQFLLGKVAAVSPAEGAFCQARITLTPHPPWLVVGVVKGS